MKLRPAALLMHRYVGLAMAAFLTVSGLTGSIIAFNHELDEWLNPSLFERLSDAPPLPATEIIAEIERQDPNIYVSFFEFEEEPDHNAVAFVQPRPDPETGEAVEPGYNQIFADPATGRIAGKREWGALRVDAAHLLPFLYKLHYSLHIPGVWGLFFMGIVAIFWTVDCLVGFYLTLPGGRPFWRKWVPAWKLKRGAAPHRRNLDLHRAGGLWLWPVLFVVALSGVALNLPDHVFKPVVGFFAELTPDLRDLAAERLNAKYDEPPQIGYPEALALAQRAAAERGIMEPASMLWYPKDYAAIGVGFGDPHGTGLGASWVFFDDRTGELLHVQIPGTGTAADTFVQLQFPLHSGQIIGLPGRILISLTGLVVAVLSVTGVLIWARKRKSARAAKALRAPDAEPHRHAAPAE